MILACKSSARTRKRPGSAYGLIKKCKAAPHTGYAARTTR